MKEKDIVLNNWEDVLKLIYMLLVACLVIYFAYEVYLIAKHKEVNSDSYLKINELYISLKKNKSNNGRIIYNDTIYYLTVEYEIVNSKKILDYIDEISADNVIFNNEENGIEILLKEAEKEASKLELNNSKKELFKNIKPFKD